MNLPFIKWIAISAILSLVACKNDTHPTPSGPPTVKRVEIPAFSGDNAFAHIETQLAFGYRVPGSAAHKEQIEWMAASLELLGANVIRQDFRVDFLGKTDVECTNVMAQFNPKHKKRVLLAAHFDSRAIADKDDERKDEPIPGADDGASGVGVLMEIARLLSEHPIDLGVDLLFLDAEDQGGPNDATGKSWALGAQLWSRKRVPSGYKAKYGILLDMVGSKNATFGKEDYSREYAPQLTNKIWTLASRMGYSDLFQDFNAGSVMDDHFYINRLAGIPMTDIINMSPANRRSFGFYHHTHDDDIDVIDKRTLRVVGQVVTAVLYKESGGSF